MAPSALPCIRRVSFTCADLRRTEEFFEHLGFARVLLDRVDDDTIAFLGLPGMAARRLVLRLGLQEVEFLQFDDPGRPYPVDSTASDGWFQHVAIVVGDMDAAHRAAIRAGAKPITRGGPETLPPNTGGVTAFKFRDPDGHPLELLYLPPGVGDPAWRERGPSPFLGIDHTAIAVCDVRRSVAFYAGLGFAETARSLNRGPAQERLDDVAADRVEVVSLTPARAPPHLELLGYRTGTRRPAPDDLRANDLAATRTIVAVADAFLETLMVGTEARRSDRSGGAGPAALILDPDRHALVLEGARRASGTNAATLAKM